MTPAWTVTLPIRTVSESNTQRSKWREKNRRAADQRSTVCLMARAGARVVGLPVVVTITRIASRSLDTQNINESQKHTTDGVADAYGLPDNDPRFTWRYAQERGDGAVRITLRRRTDGPPCDVNLVTDAENLRDRIARAAPHVSAAMEAVLAALKPST